MHNRLLAPFVRLTRFERRLWLVSLLCAAVSFILSPERDALTLIASLVGLTSLILNARGEVLGQVLMVLFSFIYGVISYSFAYYGEMITYLGMTMPIAAAAVVSWLRHPFKDSAEVAVRPIAKNELLCLLLLTALVTWVFYFILRELGTASLMVSTLSVLTSFLGASLTFLRSPYYALGYAANDVVLIALWILASLENPAYLPMILCFVMFLVNDLYGYVSWRQMQRRQASVPNPPRG
ncbi:MAG: nicotinamide mononucleotide transporter [Clostridia bacterium]|nr:nicotinamide mononucleotide transporter [Clostridia bacterium]